jgi:pimeloyl-ACP methyl ester carboxylesterase
MLRDRKWWANRQGCSKASWHSLRVPQRLDWRLAAERLRAAAHRVLAPDLPGLAGGDDSRRHSLVDVGGFAVGLVERHDLRDVTLAGHSRDGCPLTAAAPRPAPRLRELVHWGG